MTSRHPDVIQEKFLSLLDTAFYHYPFLRKIKGESKNIINFRRLPAILHTIHATHDSKEVPHPGLQGLATSGL